MAVYSSVGDDNVWEEPAMSVFRVEILLTFVWFVYGVYMYCAFICIWTIQFNENVVYTAHGTAVSKEQAVTLSVVNFYVTEMLLTLFKVQLLWLCNIIHSYQDTIIIKFLLCLKLLET